MENLEVTKVILGSIFLVVAIYVGWGLTVVRQNQSANVERFGKFHKILPAGWHILCLPGIVDKVTASPNGHDRIPVMQKFPIAVLNEGGTGGQFVDFSDDSAEVDAELWVQVGDPDWNLDSNWNLVADAAHKYVYAAGDSKARAQKIVGEFLRPQLQALTVDEALQRKGELAGKIGDVREELNKALNEMGLWLAKEKPLTIGDFKLSNETVAFRREVLEASKQAEVRTKKAAGTRRAIEIIARGEDGNGPGGALSIEEAAKVEQRLQIGEVLKGAKVSIVSTSSGAALDSLLNISDNQPKS